MNQHHETELPMLAGIAAFLAWLESLAVIISGPLLTVGLGIALVDLLTDGQLLTTAPELLYAWAIAQAIGVDAQLVGASFRAVRSARSGHGWAALAYAVLVAVLGYVAYVAAAVFAQQQADGVSTVQALGTLGMDSSTWLLQRVGISVVLVILSGALRYVPPAKAKVSAADERATLERELELEPLRQRLRAQKAVGASALARQALSAFTGREPSGVPVVSAEGKPADVDYVPYFKAPKSSEWRRSPEPPTGGGTPASADGGSEPPHDSKREAVTNGHVVALPRRVQRRVGPARGRRRSGGVRTVDSHEAAAREAWGNGATSVAKMRAATGMSASAASGWVRTLKAEQQQEQEQRGQVAL